ncbi:hypothetical protein JXA12_02545 [Candidatus Woesearchaeota archaeon]|nr:hypothetical protein [Candidatus Woesearchaeota archaeon]
MPLPLLSNDKKAQIQIGESMLVIIFVLIIGVIALVFVARMQEDKIAVRLDEYESLNAVETAQLVTNLYDLRCAKPGLTETCVDLHKAKAVASILEDPGPARDYYYSLFKDARITLVQAYPPPAGTDDGKLVLYDVGPGEGNRTTTALHIPVSVHNASANTLGFGMLVIERYRRTSI